MIGDYFFPTISLGSVDMYAEYPLTRQDWILIYTSHPLSCSDTGECTGLYEIEATNGICQGRPLITCPRSGFTEEKIYNVICSGDDSGSSESLPQPNNAAYKPTFINISNDAGPSHRRLKAKKKKRKRSTHCMYSSVSFTKKYLRRCIDPKLYDLPIKSRDGNPCIKARLIKGVNNKAKITRGWAGFFPAANMKEREIYAFAFKRNYKRLGLIMHAL
ncbi:uncharacterized protein [Aegilops tauschii subsp. strangulata]|uniref:uncharacterized protein isoform X2 n=1 Tax=Aegilops tauschii subsp. strangulata TaxID=200361 RepID=UPI003CC8ACD0